MHCVNSTAGFERPLPKYDPDLWGDRFLNFTPPNLSQEEQEAQLLKEEVRKELMVVGKDPKERLEYIDAIYRLGVAYHFECEIEYNLQSYNKELHCDNSYEDDLQYVALRFRLLRQHGFNVTCDVFNKFKCEKGGFKSSLASDIEGILNLYEASFLGVRGEHTLDEAQSFALTHLMNVATQLSSPMKEQIHHALDIPYHRRNIKLESRHQISFYESKPSHDKTLLRFAKLDFNLLQAQHNLELKDITRWLMNFDTIIKLPIIRRNRVVEGYYWILGVYYEPKYRLARLCANKMFRVISLIDDIYDAYATTEELNIFTEAIRRWDKSFTNQLPEYMQLFYEAILDLFEELEQDFIKDGRPYVVYYTREKLTITCEAYLEEAKWRSAKTVPTFEDHFRNSMITSGYLFIITAIFMGMREINKEAFEWVNENSNAPKASCVITRLIDDLADHKVDQNEREHVVSSIECYIAQFGTSEEETYEKFQSLIEEAWKDLNQELAVVEMPLIIRVINSVRVLNDIFRVGEDGYTTPKYLKPKIQAVLVDPIVI